MEESYIWTLTNRIVHILFVILFYLTYIINDDFLKLHAMFGYLFALVILFRVIWGFIGPKYSKFKDFDFNRKNLKEYLLNPFSNIKKHIGHNPASSWAIVAMLSFGFITIITGMLAYGVDENKGIFSFLYSQSLRDMEIMEELHSLSANLFLCVVIIHVLGSLIDKYIKKNDGIDSMITGYKKTLDMSFIIDTNIFQKSISIASVFIFLFAIYYLNFIPNNILIK